MRLLKPRAELRQRLAKAEEDIAGLQQRISVLSTQNEQLQIEKDKASNLVQQKTENCTITITIANMCRGWTDTVACSDRGGQTKAVIGATAGAKRSRRGNTQAVTAQRPRAGDA